MERDEWLSGRWWCEEYEADYLVRAVENRAAHGDASPCELKRAFEGFDWVCPVVYPLDNLPATYFWVKRGAKWGMISADKSVYIPCLYDKPMYFSEYLARVMRYGKWGFVDTSGKEVIPPIYDKAENFKGGVVKVKNDGEWIRLRRH